MTDQQELMLERRILAAEHGLTALQSDVLELNRRFEKDHRILVEGNGEMPVVEKVRVLESFAKSLQFWSRTIAVALVLQTITFITASAVYFIRLIPLLNELLNQK